MRLARLFVMSLAVMLMTSCSCFKKGAEGTDGGAGNIPEASAGDILKDINYAFDSSALTDTAKATLKDNAEWLKANTDKAVNVEGHCDERGTNEYNMALGDRRARAAYDYLRSLGVKESQMSTVSYGEEVPLDPAHNEAAWAKNRRAHFSFKK